VLDVKRQPDRIRGQQGTHRLLVADQDQAHIGVLAHEVDGRGNHHGGAVITPHGIHRQH
jgi:hypothetical protein